MYNSYARQDEFVDKILGHKTAGYYLDIGSHDSIGSNNTYYFSHRDWKGICVEIETYWNQTYSSRRNHTLINADAKSVNYKNVFEENNFPTVIDYLSLDVDTESLNVLYSIPFEEYKFKVITIEHDYYLHGDKYRLKQREILESNGYMLLCSDVYVEQHGFDEKESSFEDWWILSEYFDNTTIENLRSSHIYPSEIINKMR